MIDDIKAVLETVKVGIDILKTFIPFLNKGNIDYKELSHRVEQLEKYIKEGNSNNIKRDFKETKKLIDDTMSSSQELKSSEEAKELQSVLNELNDYLQQAKISHKKYDFTILQ